MSTTPAATKLKITKDLGQGRAFILIYEHGAFLELSASIFDQLSKRTRVILFETEFVNNDNWSEITSCVVESLAGLNLRQASFVAFGSAGSILQNLCITSPKLVRSAVFVDCSTRPHPSGWIKFVDRLESWLPMGLPFRADFKGFDGRSSLQRIRCPSLVVSTKAADPYMRSQAKLLAQHLPTSWSFDLVGADNAIDFSDLVLDFEKVPAKCPQKNLEPVTR